MVFKSHELQAIRCRPRYMIRPKVEKNRSGPAERTLQFDDDSIRGFLFFFFLAMVLVQATGMLYCSLAVTQRFGIGRTCSAGRYRRHHVIKAACHTVEGFLYYILPSLGYL